MAEQEATQTETVEAQNQQTEVEDQQVAPTQSEAKYTDDDVNKIVQEKLVKAKQKEREAVEEAKKLAKMNADQKQQYELEQAQKAQHDAEARLARYEMRSEARKMLAETGITFTDEDLALVVATDAETTKANVSQLAGIIDRIREGVKTELLKGKTPTATGSSITQVTESDFVRMTLAEKAKLAKDNPDLFKKITGA
ncbi:hypothetical protein WOSG25_061420 [Weissella oryzae SG25]|uniref:DUF4355 domain-containing protein n=1 Tax=Weissella oryzae (strain DSM 25784 / JCM 18191 / LMG 30913 / SG25) TaxID=1329250 RepID=A0A069CUD3_WEIOS|nr:DUF4355 domain-containing protein [Weissella oryzae]GAK31012.1 hypothetical protein WOSG25_061420 [Weissella oryzae SG25]